MLAGIYNLNNCIFFHKDFYGTASLTSQLSLHCWSIDSLSLQLYIPRYLENNEHCTKYLLGQTWCCQEMDLCHSEVEIHCAAFFTTFWISVFYFKS